MGEDNDGALKRQHNNDQHQDSQDDPLTTSPKRFKPKTDTPEGSLPPQEPLDSRSNDNDICDINEGVSHSRNGDLTPSITNGQASITSSNQQDNANEHDKQTPAASSSPFALHPILDELTNKPIYPSYEPSGMRMSMSAILTETGKGYHDRSPAHSNNTDPTPLSSSLSPSSTLPNALTSQPSTSRGQSLPPVNRFPYHHHHSPSASETRDQQQTISPSNQQHHHRTSSHPTIASTMTQPDEPAKDTQVPSSDNQQQRQSITNEQLVRALTSSIPMANEHSAPQVGTDDHHEQMQPTHAISDIPTLSSSDVKQEEPATTTLASSATLETYNGPPSQPDFGAAIRRLSGATGLDYPYGKKEDVSPSEILGSALAAVARSQHQGTTAAAAAIGNLAAITANISHILNNNNNNETNSTSSLSPQSSSLSRLTTPSGAITATPPPTIPSPVELQEQPKDASDSRTGLDHRRQSTNQVLHSGALSTMLDQAIQLGRTQQYQLQQDESSTGTNTTVNQETVDGMKRVAEAAASAAAAVAASANISTSSPKSSPVRLHNHNQHLHHQQQPAPYNASAPSMLPPHPYHHQHPYQTPLHYGPMMYATSAAATSLHAASPPIYPPQTSAVQVPKVVINNEQVWKAMKGKKESNLGFYLYQPSMLLPNLQEHLNGIVQVRIPARYLSYQNPRVKKRAIWGTGIYTDDSDVVSMAIHSGKFIPAHHDPELESNDPFLLAVAGKNMDFIRAATRKQAMSPKTYLRDRHGDDTVPDYDIKVTLRVLPKLQDYTSTIQHRIKSRKWGGNHDGVSFFVEKVEKLKKGEARPCGRSSLKNNLFRYESYRKQAPRLMSGTENDKHPIDRVV